MSSVIIRVRYPNERSTLITEKLTEDLLSSWTTQLLVKSDYLSAHSDWLIGLIKRLKFQFNRNKNCRKFWKHHWVHTTEVFGVPSHKFSPPIIVFLPLLYQNYSESTIFWKTRFSPYVFPGSVRQIILIGKQLNPVFIVNFLRKIQKS